MASNPLAVQPDAVALEVAVDSADDDAVVEVSVLVAPPQPARTRIRRVAAANCFREFPCACRCDYW
jgi:hypothetical protein